MATSKKKNAIQAKDDIEDVQTKLKQLTNELADAEMKPDNALIEEITIGLAALEQSMSALLDEANPDLRTQLEFLKVELDAAIVRLEDLTTDSREPSA
jgi:hypothetical protein